jgi:hypothetical protein
VFQKIEDYFDASMSSFPPFDRAQDKLQRESRTPAKSLPLLRGRQSGEDAEKAINSLSQLEPGLIARMKSILLGD